MLTAAEAAASRTGHSHSVKGPPSHISGVSSRPVRGAGTVAASAGDSTFGVGPCSVGVLMSPPGVCRRRAVASARRVVRWSGGQVHAGVLDVGDVLGRDL